MVSFYGVYDLPAMVTDASPRSLLVRLFGRRTLDDDSRALLRRYSPLYQAHEGHATASADQRHGRAVVGAGTGIRKRLRDLGVRHDVIALEGAPHGMENWEGHAEWTTYKERMVEWIRTLR